MTDLLPGFTTSSVGDVRHFFPIFSIHSPESLVGPCSPVPRTVSLQRALGFMEPPHCHAPSPVTWALGAWLLPSQHCLSPPQQRRVLPGTTHRSIWVLMQYYCLKHTASLLRRGGGRESPPTGDLFFTGMQCWDSG